MTKQSALSGPWIVVWCVLFAVAYTQSPLYFSNQHQYFVHGLAQADYGLLREDWLANTQDPTPAFSRLMASTYRQFGPWMYQAYYFVLLGFYLDSMRRLISVLPCAVNQGVAQWVFLSVFTATHAAIFRWASVEWLGFDYPWFLQAGVAGQYVLGTGLQPSVFGVFIIASLAAYARGRPVLAGLFIGIACVMHSTYLLPAGLISVAYVARCAWERRWGAGFAGGTVAFVLVAPVLVYIAQHFSPDDYDRYLESRRVLAEVRIPHHSVVKQWFDVVAGIQCGVMVLGIVLTYGTRLFPVLAFAAAISAILSVVQVLINGHTLALLFPWRISVVLMPISVAILCAYLGRWVENLVAKRGTLKKPVLVGCVTLMAVAVGGGIFIKAQRIGYRMNDSELPLLEYVREHKHSGDVYLLPIRFPNLTAARRGSISTTFTPPPRSKPGATLIPVDLQRFRLHSGAPIYVDFKSVPYREVEVLDWQARIRDCERWYAERDWDQNETWLEIRRIGITHIVTTADRDIRCRMLELVFSDENYRLYRLKNDDGGP